VLYDAPVPLGYNRDVPLYHYCPFQTHGLEVFIVRVEIPFDPMEPWMEFVNGSEPDDANEKMAHITLTSLCERSFAATATMPIAFFLIHDQEDPEWKQHLVAMSDLKSPRFSAGWAAMAKYASYLFNL
jgi:hypothetical protein